MKYDKIIIGAGIYGLYAALHCGQKHPQEKILVLEKEKEAFSRATYINQARVHMGYHYPRSYSTAIKSAGYFERFNRDYDFAILKDFSHKLLNRNYLIHARYNLKYYLSLLLIKQVSILLDYLNKSKLYGTR